MSSFSAPRPDFRLSFGDGAVRFTRSARTCEEVSLAAADLVDRLGALGRERRAARARLTVVLPLGTVWEARLPLPRWNPAARRRAARAEAAAGLGLAPAALAVAFGRRRGDGTTPVAAVPLARLAETRAFLAPLGLDPDRIAGAGSSLGFRGRPPALPLPPLALPRLPIVRLPAGLFAPLQRPLPPGPMLLGAGGLVAAAALGLALMPGQLAAPVARHAPAGAPAAAPAAPTVIPRTAESVPAPRHRPKDLPRLALLPEAGPAVAPAIVTRPAELAAAAVPGAVRVTMGTRNLPLAPLAPLPARVRADDGLRVAELGKAAVTLTDAIMPRPRPATLRDPAVERIGAAPEQPLADPPAAVLRPRWRPAAPVAALPGAMPGAAAAATLAAAAAPGARPAPRPLRVSAATARPAPRQPAGGGTGWIPEAAAFAGGGRSAPRRTPAPLVRVASLAPATDVSAVPAVRSPALPAAPATTAVGSAVRTAVTTAAKPPRLPAPVAPAAARAATGGAAAKPAPQRVASLQPAAKVPARSLPRAPVSTTLRKAPVTKVAPAYPTPAEARKPRLQPVAVRTAPAKPARLAKAQPATEKVGLSRRGASLIGVFGDADGRYALVQTGRGKVAKVKAGDSLDGAVVAAIGRDSVRLDGPRDTVLRLPD